MGQNCIYIFFVDLVAPQWFPGPEDDLFPWIKIELNIVFYLGNYSGRMSFLEKYQMSLQWMAKVRDRIYLRGTPEECMRGNLGMNISVYKSDDGKSCYGEFTYRKMLFKINLNLGSLDGFCCIPADIVRIIFNYAFYGEKIDQKDIPMHYLSYRCMTLAKYFKLSDNATILHIPGKTISYKDSSNHTYVDIVYASGFVLNLIYSTVCDSSRAYAFTEILPLIDRDPAEYGGDKIRHSPLFNKQVFHGIPMTMCDNRFTVYNRGVPLVSVKYARDRKIVKYAYGCKVFRRCSGNREYSGQTDDIIDRLYSIPDRRVLDFSCISRDSLSYRLLKRINFLELSVYGDPDSGVRLCGCCMYSEKLSYRSIFRESSKTVYREGSLHKVYNVGRGKVEISDNVLAEFPMEIAENYMNLHYETAETLFYTYENLSYLDADYDNYVRPIVTVFYPHDDSPLPVCRVHGIYGSRLVLVDDVNEIRSAAKDLIKKKCGFGEWRNIVETHVDHTLGSFNQVQWFL